MYCIFKKIYEGIEIFLYPHLLTPKKLFWRGGVKIDVTEMMHLLTFQSIKKYIVLFFNFGGGI